MSSLTIGVSLTSWTTTITIYTTLRAVSFFGARNSLPRLLMSMIPNSIMLISRNFKGRSFGLKSELDVSHLSQENASALIGLIKEYWCVFDERGIFTPVWYYQCVIGTGNASPIAIKKNCMAQERFLLGKCVQ